MTLVAHSAGVLTTVALGPAARPAGPRRVARHTAGPRAGRCPRITRHWLSSQPTAGCRSRVSRLPFPSILAASTNDALGDVDNVRALAAAWGSQFIDIGPVGHLNPASGYGEWPGAEALLDVLSGMLLSHRPGLVA